MVELMVTIALGMIVILGIFALTEVAIRSSARTAARVDANQRARPVLPAADRRAALDLHRARGGTDPRRQRATTQLSFLHQTGSAVSPIPGQARGDAERQHAERVGLSVDRRRGARTGCSRPPRRRPASCSPTSARRRSGDPPVARADLPLLRTYDGGASTRSPLPTPLSAERTPS